MRVLEKGSVKIKDKILTFKQPTKDHNAMDTHDSIPVQEEEQKASNDVIVIGIPPTVTDEEIEMLFENKGKTGGGDVSSVKLDRTSGIAVVTFEDTAGKNAFEHHTCTFCLHDV